MAEWNEKEAELARREALLAEREAQLEKEQAELEARRAQGEAGKKSLLNNNDPNFVNPKEKLYDKFPLSVHQMDIIIGVLFALIVLFLVLQQIEGNLIYPHVVGSSVGLPSIWVLAAVTVGGSLMGILGMLVFIPLCSVLYALLRQLTIHRLKQRRVPAEKWREPPKK